jgi:two-component system, NarL family, sensor kinase
MKSKILNVILIIVFTISGPFLKVCHTEPGKADSLRNQINKVQDGREKADILLSLGTYYYSRSDFDSCLYYSSKANELSVKLNYYEVTADSWYRMITCNIYLKSFDQAEILAEKYIDIATIQSDSLRLEKGYFIYGFLLKETGMNEMGISYSRRSTLYSGQGSDPRVVIENLRNLGILFKNISEYDSAAVYLLKALGNSEIVQDDSRTAQILNNIGDVYSLAEYYETARSYYEKALELNRRAPGKESGIALNYNNLGRLESSLQHYDKAKEYYDKSLELFTTLKDSSGIYDIYNNYGDLYYRQEKFSLAADYFRKALDGYIKSNYLLGMVTGYGNMTAVYLMEGNSKQGMAMHDSCLRLTYIIGNRDLRMDAYWNVASLFSKIGNYEQSHEFLMKFIALKDSIYDLKRTKFTYDLIVKYEKEKDAARILTLEKENLKKTIQRNFILYSSVGLILIALFGFLYLKQRAVKDKIIAAQKIRQLEEEKKLMVAKMIVEGQEEERKRIATELHDGLGVLLSATKMQFTSIMDTSPENRPVIEKAIKLLEQASGDVRKISHNMMPGLLTKLGFFEAVEDLFDNLNDAGNLEAVLEISGSQERMPENREIMLYRIVQEMVNNTLKHAQASKIKLRIDVLTDQIVMVFADNGKGFDAEKILRSETSSLGLKSIKSRVNFLSGEVDIESRPGEGVKYTIQLPVS